MFDKFQAPIMWSLRLDTRDPVVSKIDKVPTIMELTGWPQREPTGRPVCISSQAFFFPAVLASVVEKKILSERKIQTNIKTKETSQQSGNY